MTFNKSNLSHLLLLISFIWCGLCGLNKTGGFGGNPNPKYSIRTIECGESQTGDTTSSFPEKFVTFILQNPQIVTISTCSSNYDTQIWLYQDSQFRNVYSNIGSCDNSNEYSNNTLPSMCTKCNCQYEGEIEYGCNEYWTDIVLTPNTYYIKIVGFNGQTGFYRLTLNCLDIVSSTELPISVPNGKPTASSKTSTVSSKTLQTADPEHANQEDADPEHSDTSNIFNFNDKNSLYVICGIIIGGIICCSALIIIIILFKRQKNNASGLRTPENTDKKQTIDEFKHVNYSNVGTDNNLPNEGSVPKQNPKTVQMMQQNVDKSNEVNDDVTVIVVVPQSIPQRNEMNDDPSCLYVGACFGFFIPLVGFIMMCVYRCGKNLPPKQAKAYRMMCSCTALGFIVNCIIYMIQQL